MPKKKNVRKTKKNKKKAPPRKKIVRRKKAAPKKRPAAKKTPTSRAILVETLEIDTVSVTPTEEALEDIQEEVDNSSPDIGGSE
jgi:hypothetical protein